MKENWVQTGQWVTVALRISGPVFEGERGDKKVLFDSPLKTMYHPAFLLELPSQKTFLLPSFPQNISPVFFPEMFGPALLWGTLSP
jgi:hypothetical protein